MRVRELMTKRVATVTPDTSLRDTASVLVERRVSGVPVVGAHGDVVGVLSEADIVTRAGGRTERSALLNWLFDTEFDGEKVTAETAGEAMSSPAVTIAPGKTVHDAARLMIDEGVNRLPVVDDGVLVGIVTRADIVRAFTRTDAELASEILDDVLRRTFWAEPGSVTVSVTDGRVALAGQVETEADAEMLPLLVSRIPGVIAVRADLRPRSPVA